MEVDQPPSVPRVDHIKNRAEAIEIAVELPEDDVVPSGWLWDEL